MGSSPESDPCQDSDRHRHTALAKAERCPDEEGENEMGQRIILFDGRKPSAKDEHGNDRKRKNQQATLQKSV